MPPFQFTRNLPLLNQNGSLGFDVSGAASPAVAAALATPDGRFPDGDIEVASLKLAASSARPIEFGRGVDKVSFAARGSAFAGLGLYRSAAALLPALGAADDETVALRPEEFGVRPGGALAVLRWGYAADAKGNGAMALGAVGAATAEVSGSGEGLFAVVRRVDDTSTVSARTIVQDVADHWLPPRQLSSVDQLEPGTWLVAETAGSLGLSLGATLGYDFNWVREAALGGLTGDIGLRLQMGIDATARVSVSGRCAVVVSRESAARTLRLRVFRMKSRQVGYAVNAALGLQLQDTVLPGKVDDFISAVFGVHGQQLLRDLAVVEKWTDPKTPLSTLLAEAGVNGAEGLIAAVAGVSPEELQRRFDSVHTTVVGFVSKWQVLPHTLASTLLKLVDQKVDLGEVRAVARALSTIEPDGLARLIEERLQGAGFFNTPVGQLLEALGGDSVLALLERPVAELRAVAATLLSVLDGGTVEASLVRFQRYVDARLNLGQLLPAIVETDAAALDALLKTKLAAFLGRQSLGGAELEQVRGTIHLLVSRRQEYYARATEALHRKYAFALNAAAQSTTTGQAMVDVTFDCSRDEATVMPLVQRALRGELDELLLNPPAAVTVRTGMLTHGISRQSHIDVTLPFLERSQAHLAESTASIEAVPHEGGLLLKVNASDTVMAGNQRKSILSVALALSSDGVRVHRPTLALDYSLLYARRDLRKKDLRVQVGPAIRTYFAGKIASTERFLDAIDRQVEAVVPNGPNLLGNGLVSLDISLPASAAEAVGLAWLGLPADRRAPQYEALSRGVQSAMKEAVHASLFGSPDDYTRLIPARTHVFLAYCALAPRAQAGAGWYWNWPSVDERRTLLRAAGTRSRMKGLLEQAQRALADAPSRAAQFNPGQAADILARVDAGDPFLNSLLVAENEIVKDAVAAGVALAHAREGQPTEAVKALARFGARFTEAFHADLTTLFGPGIRALGTRVLLGATRAIAPAAAGQLDAANALLSIEFLTATAAFDERALLDAGHVRAADLAFAARVIRASRAGGEA